VGYAQRRRSDWDLGRALTHGGGITFKPPGRYPGGDGRHGGDQPRRSLFDTGRPMLSFRKSYLVWAAPLLFLVLAGGCGGSGPTIVPVTGTLTYKGKPVTNARIDFMPDNGRPSWGATDEEGRFKLNYDREHDGAVVGKHKVWVKMVQSRPTTKAEQEAAIMGKKLPMSRDVAAFFDKYGEKNSKVEVVIDKSTKELKLDWD